MKWFHHPHLKKGDGGVVTQEVVDKAIFIPFFISFVLLLKLLMAQFSFVNLYVNVTSNI